MVICRHRTIEMNSQATEYLTQASLGRFLQERVDPAIVAGQLIPGVSRRYRPDFRSERHRLIVEFDGDEHYRSAKKILGDEERDRALACVGYRIVRIPYFVQLTRVVIATLFGEIAIHHGDFLNFPHGFIAKTVVMPADFCELGITRFEADLERFSYIRQEILESLRRAIESCGDWRVVCPPSRRDVWGVSS
jgi:hypothetical protein